MGTHRKGQGRKPIFPKDFEGKNAINDWKAWARQNGMSPMSIAKMGSMIRAFFIYASNTDNVCRDFCKPYLIENKIAACSVCRLDKNKRSDYGTRKPSRDLNWRDLDNYKRFMTSIPAKPSNQNVIDDKFKFRTKTTINAYLGACFSWFEMMADTTQSTKWRKRFNEVKSISKLKHAHKKQHKSIKLETLLKIIDEAKKESYENYTVLMLLLYTGGRAQFYGLKVDEIQWGEKNGDTSEGMPIERMGIIRTKTKGGKSIEIPLHPKLQKILKKHLKTRTPESPMLFKYGRDAKTKNDFDANVQVPWRMLKKLAKKLKIQESIYTHRIRKTVGKYGPKLGIDPRFMQIILTHEDFATTQNIYREVDLEDVGKEWGKVDFEESVRKKDNDGPNVDEIFSTLDDILGQIPEIHRKGIQSIFDGVKVLIKNAVEDQSV